MSQLQLVAFPEELLERILSLALAQPESPISRPPWIRSSHLAPLYISRQLNRIATPLLYHDVHIPSNNNARLLLATLSARPELVHHIRALSIAGVWQDAALVIALAAPYLRQLDLTVSITGDVDLTVDDAYAATLLSMTKLRHLTLRKPNNVYLSLPRPRAIINAVALAINHWPHLRTAHIAFKLSDDTPTSPILSPPNPILSPSKPSSSSQSLGPISLLASSLASAPSLHTFTTHLPSVWNLAIPTVSANPKLERIVLVDGRSNSFPPPPYALPHHHQQQKSQGIVGTGLFLKEARKYPRLSELIRAGTPVMRSRAQTLSSPSSSSASDAQHFISGNSSNPAPRTRSSMVITPSAPIASPTCSVRTIIATAPVTSGTDVSNTLTPHAAAGSGATTVTKKSRHQSRGPSPLGPSSSRGGLGLRIDTSSAAVTIAAKLAQGSAKYASGFGLGWRDNNGSRSAVVGVNPSWLGSLPGSAGGNSCGSGGLKGKGGIWRA